MLRGALAAALTPLRDDDTLDEDAFAPYADFLAAGGLDGVLALGTTGESLLFSVSERRRVAELYVEAARGKLQVAINAGAQSTADTVALAAHAAEAGADAVAVIAPPYFPLDDESVFGHLSAAAERARAATATGCRRGARALRRARALARPRVGRRARRARDRGRGRPPRSTASGRSRAASSARGTRSASARAPRSRAPAQVGCARAARAESATPCTAARAPFRTRRTRRRRRPHARRAAPASQARARTAARPRRAPQAGRRPRAPPQRARRGRSGSATPS